MWKWLFTIDQVAKENCDLKITITKYTVDFYV